MKNSHLLALVQSDHDHQYALAQKEARLDLLEALKKAKVAGLIPDISVYHLDHTRYIIRIIDDPNNTFAFQDVDIEGTYKARILDAHTLFLHSKLDPEELKENIEITFIPH